MLYQALARALEQGATRSNCYSLFECRNAVIVFELSPRRASHEAGIFVVNKF